jgi:hypothetical protein
MLRIGWWIVCIFFNMLEEVAYQGAFTLYFRCFTQYCKCFTLYWRFIHCTIGPLHCTVFVLALCFRCFALYSICLHILYQVLGLHCIVGPFTLYHKYFTSCPQTPLHCTAGTVYCTAGAFTLYFRYFTLSGIRIEWQSHSNVRIGSRQVHSIVTCLYSK